jgi:hypothetical protein
MRANYSRQQAAIFVSLLVALSVVFSGMVVVAQEGPTDGNELAPEDRQETTYLRVLHATAGAPSVDVYLDNQSVLTDVSFGSVSDYQELGAGLYNVTITEADNRENVLFQDTINLEPRGAQTLAASGQVTQDAEAGNATDAPDDSPIQPILYSDDALAPEDDSAAVSLVHLSPDAPAVDVVTANGTVIAEDLQYQQISDYVTVPAGDYTLEVRTATEDAEDEEVPAPATPGDNETAPNATDGVGDNATADNATADNATNGAMDNMTDDGAAANATDDGQAQMGEVVATVNVTLEGGNAYSAVAVGTVSAEDGNQTTEMPAEDNVTDDAADNATDGVGDNATAGAADNATDDAADNATDAVDDNETETPGVEVGDNATADNATADNATDNTTAGAAGGAAVAQVAEDNETDSSFRVVLTEDAVTDIELPGAAAEETPTPDAGVGDNETETPGVDVGDNETETPGVDVGDNETETPGVDDNATETPGVDVGDNATDDAADNATAGMGDNATTGAADNATDGVDDNATDGVDDNATDGVDDNATDAGAADNETAAADT